MIKLTLAAARVNAGMNQEEAAKKLGLTAKTLRNYEKGVTAIPGFKLRLAAKIYQIPEDCIRLPIVDDGIYDEDEKNLGLTTF